MTVCGERKSCSAISRFVEPRARSGRAPRARARSAAGRPAPRSGRKTVMPSPTMRTAPAMSAAGQSLEMKPAAPAARAAFGRDPAGARDQQHVGGRRAPRAAARRSRRPTPGRRTGRRARRAGCSAASAPSPRRRCARSGSARPTAARRASAAGPSARPRGRRRRARAAGARRSRRRSGSGLTSGTLMRHRQSHAPDTRLALAELDQPADLERLERREPQPHPATPCGGRPRARRRCTPPSPTRRPGRRQRDLHPGRLRVLVRVAHRLGEHGLGERLELARHADVLAAGRERDPELGMALVQPLDLLLRASCSVSRAARPSGRCSARRRSRRPAWSSTRHALARLVVSGASLETTSSTPNRRWITLSCTSRARSIRSCSWRARAPAGRSRGARPRRAPTVLPSVHSRSRSSSDERAARAAVGEDHAAPAPAGRERARRRACASSSRSRKRSGTSRATVSASISITRSSTSAWRAIGADSTVDVRVR